MAKVFPSTFRFLHLILAEQIHAKKILTLRQELKA